MIVQLRRLKRTQFSCRHRKRDQDSSQSNRIYTIEGFGNSAKDTKFEMTRTQRDGTESKHMITVYDYYVQTYNIRLRYPRLPLVKTKKVGELYPMELCHIPEGQRYPYKLDDRQTSEMIKVSQATPRSRKCRY